MNRRENYPNTFHPEFKKLLAEAVEHDPLAHTEVYEVPIKPDINVVNILMATVEAIRFTHRITVQNYQAYAYLLYKGKRADEKIINPIYINDLVLKEIMKSLNMFGAVPYFPPIEDEINYCLKSLSTYQPLDGSKPKPMAYDPPKSLQGSIVLNTKDLRFHMKTNNMGQIDETIRIKDLPHLHCAYPVLFPRAGNVYLPRLIVHRDDCTGTISIKFQCKGRLSLKYIATHGFPTDPGYISPV